MMTQQRYPFITIEGIEGVGKSTALKFTQDYLTKAKREVVITREPGGTVIAEKIRELLLQPMDELMTPDTELLLMFAARSQHIVRFILPALQAGKCVVSDRFVDASYAYQGAGRHIDMDRIAMLEDWILKGLRPLLTILLDAPPIIGLTRAKHRGPHDRIEMEKVEFFERVRVGYLARAKQDTKRFRIIDATKPLAEVHADIKLLLDELVLGVSCEK